MSQSPDPPPESSESPSKDFDEFIKYNYGETKELAKMLITLLSGILLFSINFSDKVGGIQNAPPYYRFLLLGSWSCLLLSIMGCGLALVISWTAARGVLWSKSREIRERVLHRSKTAADIVAASGFVFIVGLGFMIAAGFTAFSR
jgi:hypothetical protein